MGAAGFGALLSACAGQQSVLDPAGAQARTIEQLWWVLLAVSCVVFVAVVGALAFALWPRRRGTAESVDVVSVRWVSGATGATLVILIGLFVASMWASQRATALTSAEDFFVDVGGHQWWWDVRYLYPESPSLSARTANEIHLPAGRAVRMRLRSRDVIHSLWLPNIHGKMDLIPGRENHIVVKAERPGVYRGQCAEFCGMQHAKMAFTVVVHPPEEFDAWLARQRRPADAPANPLAVRGREVFLGSGCAACHTVRGTGAHAFAGPDLTHVASRRTLAAGIVPNVRGHLAGWLSDPQSLKPGNHMPRIPLSPLDLHALTAYLETLE